MRCRSVAVAPRHDGSPPLVIIVIIVIIDSAVRAWVDSRPSRTARQSFVTQTLNPADHLRVETHVATSCNQIGESVRSPLSLRAHHFGEPYRVAHVDDLVERNPMGLGRRQIIGDVNATVPTGEPANP
jgi:hypothetical protein